MAFCPKENQISSPNDDFDNNLKGKDAVTAEKYETTYYFNAMFPERVPNSAGFSSCRGTGAAAPVGFVVPYSCEYT